MPSARKRKVSCLNENGFTVSKTKKKMKRVKMMGKESGKSRMIKAFTRQKVEGLVPHFEMVFFLTMEKLGRVHPSHRDYYQWGQMSEKEKRLHDIDMAHCYVDIAEIYHHDAIFAQVDTQNPERAVRVLEAIRELDNGEHFVMIHGDPTFAIPDGNAMMDFSVRMYEDMEGLIAEQEENRKKWSEAIYQISKHKGLIDCVALCSDYAFNVNPFFTPEVFEDLIAPCLKQCIDDYRAMGLYTMKHTDGNINPILDQIVACGPDAIQSVDPQGGMSLSGCMEKYNDKVCFVGNVNCGLLQTGTDEEAAEDVRRALREGMSKPTGFVFSTSNCVYTGMPLERYEMMNAIWQTEGRYC